MVDVTDMAGVLAGYWHSLGTAGQNNNSQTDPYAVTLTPAAPNNLTADFGYYVLPAAIGNYVWADADTNGIQNPGEPPLTGVVVMLTITYPGAGPGGGDLTVALKTATDGTGYYSFGNLLLDEHTPPNTGAPTPPAPPQPGFSISAVTPSGSSPTITNAAGATACADNATLKCNDSDNPAGTTATPLKGQTDASLANTTSSIASYDFGFTSTPTAVALRGLAASTAVPMALPLGAVALTVLGVFTWWVRRQR